MSAKKQLNYKNLFIFGILFIAINSYNLFNGSEIFAGLGLILGIVMLIIGIKNKSKWK